LIEQLRRRIYNEGEMCDMVEIPTRDATRICLVRHGETEWNVARRLQGQLDIGLNTLGLRQAEAAAAWLDAEPDPGVSAIYSFRPSDWPWSPDAFYPTSTGNGSQPWDIKVAADGYPWFTEPRSNRVGRYFTTTYTDIFWYSLPVLNSLPHSLDIAQGAIWFTEKDGNRVGQLQPSTSRFREFALPNAAPTGIAVDASGCAWVAASGKNALISWCPPYFRSTFLPLVMKDI
jgi:streptogramin lyase